ncbi:MAG TPA: hypothetical protein VH062_23785 [Polyangiaceae bacterium]|jgi:hypothetical protein|nr:hypothetical protein [Polyangiaceae bacterium]
MAKLIYDTSAWPIVLVSQSGEMTTPELRAHLDRMSAYFERGRFGLIQDVRGTGTLTAADRRILAEWFDAHVARYPDRIACFGVVLDSTVQRSIFKAISWLTSAPFEREAFRDVEPAKKWAHACLRAPIMAQLRARRASMH